MDAGKIIHAVFVLVQICIIIVYKSFIATIRMLIPSELKMTKVENKNVLITGAGSGLGAALAVRFARRKAKLFLWDINEEGLKKVMDECCRYQSETSVFIYKVDISNRNDVLEAAQKIILSHGHVDILINNAGIVSGKDMLNVDENTVRKVFDVNVSSHLWTVQAFLPTMVSRRTGHIVSIASVAGLFSTYKLADYSASKFAAVGFQESVLNEVHYRGLSDEITVLTVCPFFINTGMFDGVTSKFALLPILELDYAADKIEEAILIKSQFLAMPKFVYLAMVLKSIVPVNIYLKVVELIGANRQMETFKGRQEKVK